MTLPPAANKIIYKMHRWGSLFLVFFILYYCLTGIILNHRQFFGYFIDKEVTTSQVEPADLTGVNRFIDYYKNQLGRSDSPKVIRIKDGKTVEFLYGSHGKTTYIIEPATGNMQTVIKHPQQPFYRLNQLHKVVATGKLWIILSDLLSIVLVLISLSIMVVMRYRVIDILMLAAGLLILVTGALCA